MKSIQQRSLLICVFAILVLTVSAGQNQKPKVRVATDGFPTGQDTPEGVAADFTRAFINTDAALFSGSCIRPYGGDQVRDAYSNFLHGVVESMKYETQKKLVSAKNPKKIGKVFAARHLSANGPASYGQAAFDFQDIMFVDVGVFLQNGEPALNRTLVVKDRDGKWYVHPAPNISPLLSSGLNEEKASVQDFSGVYDIQK
jgi:hypothetical protein